MASPSLPSVLDAWREVIHPAALILPRPSETEYADLKQSIEERGLLTPLGTFVDANNEHWLLDGVSRLQVMVELGHTVLDPNGRWAVPTTPYYAEQGADPYEIAMSLNVTRRHLTTEQKREVIRDLREARPELSDRAIARMAGVSPHTVAAVREAETTGNGVDAEVDGYVEAETSLEETGEEETREAKPAEPERREETGRRARGRKLKAKDEPVAVLPARPFIGTVLPSASKTQRVAEARRCLKYLNLVVEDLQRRR